MVESVASGKPEGHLLKEIRTLRAGKMKVWPLREQLDRTYQTYVALCRRTHKVPVITEQTVVGIYLRYLPEEFYGRRCGTWRPITIWKLSTRPPSLPPLGKIAELLIRYYGTLGAPWELTGM